jgi:hypothetical protein
MYVPNFLDGFDRLVAFDAETTGSVPLTPSLFISSLLPGELLASSSKSVSSTCCVKARAGARARRGAPRSTRMARSTPRPLRSTGFGQPILRTPHGFQRSCRK